MAKYPCHLRKFRKSAHLPQSELAHLLGLHSQGQLSDIEAGVKRPGIGVAVACAVIFETSVEEIFPGLVENAEHVALCAAQEILQHNDMHDRSGECFVAALIQRLSAAKTGL